LLLERGLSSRASKRGKNLLAPNIKTVILDEEREIRFEILAYRKLTQQEMISSVRSFLAQNKHKKLKAGQTIILLTTYH
jgi:hypothetical protein